MLLPTAVAAVVAASAAATTATASAAITTAAAATATILAWAGLVDDHIAAVIFLTVELRDRRGRIVIRRHLDKPETARAARLAVHHDIGGLYLAGGRKMLMQIFARHPKRQISYV